LSFVRHRPLTLYPLGHEEEEHELYAYDHETYSPPPMGPNANAYPPPPRQDYYPSTNAFPPPPMDDYSREPDYQQEYPPYNPADYPPPPGATPQPVPDQRVHDRYDPNLGYPTANETYAGDPRYNTEPRGRAAHDDVSPNLAAPGVVVDGHDPTPGGSLSSTLPFDHACR